MQTQIRQAEKFCKGFARSIAFSIEHTSLEEIASLEKELQSNPEERDVMGNLAELINSCNAALVSENTRQEKSRFPPQQAGGIVGILLYFYENSSEEKRGHGVRPIKHYPSRLLFDTYFGALKKQLDGEGYNAALDIDKNLVRTIRYAATSGFTGILTALIGLRFYDSGFLGLIIAAGGLSFASLVYMYAKHKRREKKLSEEYGKILDSKIKLEEKRQEFLRRHPDEDAFYRILEKYKILIKPLLYAKLA